MATPKTLRPLLHEARTPRPRQLVQRPQRRTFLPNPFSASPFPTQPSYQTLSATRTLPYAPAPIYHIISSVSSYADFLPYCHSSRVTRWSAPDATYHRRWPSEADIAVGFGGVSETFRSSIFCVPGRIVESVGGGTGTELGGEEVAHHFSEAADSPPSERGEAGRDSRSGSGLLTHLKSRWTLEELGEQKTRVSLSLEYAFANPIYMTLSAGAAPRVAEVMCGAFEERVHDLLGRRPEMARMGLGELDEGGQGR